MIKPVFFDKVTEALEAGFATGHNVLLYGPPGHNKSKGAEWFLGTKGVKPDDIFIKSVSSGTSIEDMYGGIDLALMRDEGALRYRLESPEFFGNYEYVIFDEILDAKEKVLASLKDTLMAREVRNGSQRYPLKTKMVIGLTNVDAADFEDNWERAAILERFPIRVLVKWDDYSPEAFRSLMEAVIAKDNLKKVEDFAKRLAVFAASSHAEGNGVTPRTVVQALSAVVNTGNEGFGWTIVGSQNTNVQESDLPRELILKWRVSQIQSVIKDRIRQNNFDSLMRILNVLTLYANNEASSEEKEMLQPVIDDLNEKLVTKLMVA